MTSAHGPAGTPPRTGSPGRWPASSRRGSSAAVSPGAASCGPRASARWRCPRQAAGRLRHRGHEADRGHLQEHRQVATRRRSWFLQLAALHRRGRGRSTPPSRTFQKESGIKVTYNDDVNDNNEFFGKVRNQLGACQPTGRDIFVLTDWMAARMVQLGWIQKLDTANMPNVETNLVDSLQEPALGQERSTPCRGSAA